MNNLFEHIPVDAGDANAPGVIHASNEARFSGSHLSEPLTTFASGVLDRENLREALDQIAPPIDAPRRFEYRKADSDEDFLSESDDVRAIDAPFKRVQTRGSVVNARTENKGLTIRLDKDGEGALPNAAERAAARLVRRVLRNDLVRAVNLLVSSASNTGKTWSTSVDPDVDLLDLVNASGDARGINANVLYMDYGAWSTRIASLSGSKSSCAFAKLLWTPEQLAGWLGVERIIRTDVRVKPAGAAAKQRLSNGYVVAYYADRNPGLDSPTNLARFVTPTDGGDVRVYVEDHPKFIDVSVEHYSLVATPSTLGVLKYTIANA